MKRKVFKAWKKVKDLSDVIIATGKLEGFKGYWKD